MPIRAINVVAAVAQDDDGRFFVSFSQRWNAYTFPMTKPRAGEPLDKEALRAFEEHVGPLPKGKAMPLESVGAFGPSWSGDKETYYKYVVCEVAPGRSLPAGALAEPCGYLDFGQLVASPLVSWSAKEIARALESKPGQRSTAAPYVQESSLALLCRRGASGKRELLFIQNAPHQKDLFFPSGRLCEGDKPEPVAQQVFQADTRYDGEIVPSLGGEAMVRQKSVRYATERSYRFHLCRITLPKIDLHDPRGELARALNNSGLPWSWIGEDDLARPAANGLSETAAALRADVLRAVDEE
ncbi:MAG TPA: hypothetical protein VND64_16400 [Pirellulales bacterium]|nr:hypothetical protein [Pirellulales bacterium]